MSHMEVPGIQAELSVPSFKVPTVHDTQNSTMKGITGRTLILITRKGHFLLCVFKSSFKTNFCHSS